MRRDLGSAHRVERMAASLVAAGAVALCGPAAADPLPLFRGDPARTGYLAEGPEPPLELRWTFETRRGVMEIESFPAVDDGLSAPTVYQGVVYVGGHDGCLYALDATGGRKLWEFATAGRVNSTPALGDGRVVFGSMDNFVYALSAEDGSLVWRFESGVKAFRQITYGGVRASPVLRDGAVYIGG